MPDDPIVSRDIINAASFLKGKEDGYLLEENKALPHLTLCQFEAPDDTSAQRLTAQFIKMAIHLTITEPAVRNDRDNSSRAIWIEYRIAPLASLIETQNSVYTHLKALKLDLFTRTLEEYSPHITLGRSQYHDIVLPKSLQTYSFVGRPTHWTVRLSHCDKNGQVTSIL
jgi:2'-5' RNA ligase